MNAPGDGGGEGGEEDRRVGYVAELVAVRVVNFGDGIQGFQFFGQQPMNGSEIGG